MPATETIVIAGATQKVVFSSALFGSMILFQDPAYIIVAIVGAFVSMGSAHYDMIKLQNENDDYSKGITIFIELSKAFMIGLLFSLLSFLLLLTSGESIVSKYVGKGLITASLPSIWMIATIFLATASVDIYGWVKNKLGGIK